MNDEDEMTGFLDVTSMMEAPSFNGQIHFPASALQMPIQTNKFEPGACEIAAAICAFATIARVRAE